MLEINTMQEVFMKKSKEELVDEISKSTLIEILFQEKKNYNSKEMTEVGMVKEVKKIIEREVSKKYDLQKDESA